MKLSDCCLKIGSGATPRGGKESYLEEGPFSLIRSQNIHNNLFVRAGLAFISDLQAKQLQNVDVKPDDVLLNITGDSVARVCQVPKDVLPARVNQHVAIIRPNPTKLIHKYLHYFLVNPKMQTHMLNLASAGATRNALTKGMIESFDVPLTSITDQKAIASVLGTLDEKIENNRRMNETLEEMARAIFKSWFVDFDPVHAKAAGKTPAHMDAETAALFPSSFGNDGLPIGWELRKIEEITTLLKRGITPKYSENGCIVINQKCIRNETINFDLARRHNQNIKPLKEKELRLEDVLINSTGVGTLGRVATVRILTEPTSADTHVTIARPNPKMVEPIILGILLESIAGKITDMGHGSTGQTELKPSLVGAIQVAIPSRKIQSVFQNLVSPLRHKVTQNLSEFRTLAELRDTLLPKLISGEIRVKDAEREVEAAV